MDPILKSVEEYIKSGEYFRDARSWYNFKYLYPLSQRSFLLFIAAFVATLLLILVLNIYSLLPIIVQVRYALYTNSYESTASIKKADQIQNSSLASIADIMVRSYITTRESYDYNSLRKQFIFIQNNSTRLVFRKFFSYMSIDNSLSPVMRYKKETKRSIEVISSSYPEPGQALIIFHSVAKMIDGAIFEDMIWEAQVNYNIDDIDLNAASDTKFNFVVTNYYLKLLQNKIKNK
jgi:type IV secretion system protein VirB8